MGWSFVFQKCIKMNQSRWVRWCCFVADEMFYDHVSLTEDQEHQCLASSKTVLCTVIGLYF